MIRSLKKEIINELNIWQNTNAENCQLKIDIHHFQEKLKELNILCINCETSNAEIEHRKKRYSEQLTKISKLISEQNFDAANWAIILDEMAFANRELFEILLSTATVERRALQLETAEEDKYRNTSERLNLRRIELRQELYSQMNNYESLREQINQTESNLTNLQKAIDVYDAEYWQLNDAEHNLQSQIFQLQELLRHSRRHRRFNSTSESSSPLTDTADKNESEEYKSDECLITKRKFNTTIPHRNISKKGNFDITNAKSKCQVLPKTTPDTKRKQVADETSDSSSNIRSDFMWKKKETDSKLNQPVSPTSSVPSNTSCFLVQHHKSPSKLKLMVILLKFYEILELYALDFEEKFANFYNYKKSQYQKQIQQKDSNWSSSMESFKTTPSQTMTTETKTKKENQYSGLIKLTGITVQQPKRQKSRIDLKKRGKISGGMNKGTVNEIGDNQESITDFQSSEENKIIDSSKSSNFLISDDETTDLTSESISLSDALPSKTNIISPISSITKDQVKKLSSLSDNSSGQETKFRQPSHISESENSSEISTNTNDLSQQQQQRQQLMRQPSYNQSLNQGLLISTEKAEFKYYQSLLKQG
ncbi:unnamed protein product [Brugia timori]|uniref:Uncharacterized protein n=1 Tax=Brugia timori TaxID=42155 RepID=A0A0R3QZE0_9BILA|nr:unnamed protein product [Brugia timori]